jgi:hypothetical protein
MDTAKVAERTNHRQCRWIGRGVYTPAEASRLTGISPGRIRRWLRRGEQQSSPPILHPEIGGRDDGIVALTFRDLKEKTIRYIADWYAVSVASVRAAIE